MKFSYKTRRRLSIAVLCIGLPAYIILVVSLMNAIGRLPIVLEVIAYVVAGVAWVFPCKSLFQGVGKAAPDE